MQTRSQQMHKQFRIGLRTIKTAIAVFFCLLIQLILPGLSALNAAIAAIVCMRETPGKSFETGLNRFIGTLIGGLFGLILVLLAPWVPFYTSYAYILLLPVFMIFCISVCVWLNKFDAVIICCVVFLIIALDREVNPDEALVFVGLRILDTTIGITFATLINKFFFPYRGKMSALPGIDMPKYVKSINTSAAADKKDEKQP